MGDLPRLSLFLGFSTWWGIPTDGFAGLRKIRCADNQISIEPANDEDFRHALILLCLKIKDIAAEDIRRFKQKEPSSR